MLLPQLLSTFLWFTVCLEPLQAMAVPRHAVTIEHRNVNVEYDFIIAGAGPSGLTVADRLTEHPSSELSISGYRIVSKTG